MADARIDTGEGEIELRALVGHAHSVSATATVETALAVFARHGIDFIAVLEAGRLLGVCARRELTESLGSRFGFALNARRPVVEQLMTDPLRITTGSELTEVFKAVAARCEREFYDDVCLVAIEVTQVECSPVSADVAKPPLSDLPAEVDRDSRTASHSGFKRETHLGEMMVGGESLTQFELPHYHKAGAVGE